MADGAPTHSFNDGRVRVPFGALAAEGYVRLSSILAPHGPIPVEQINLVGGREKRTLSQARQAWAQNHCMAVADIRALMHDGAE